MNKEHFRGVVWPRAFVKEGDKVNYRYVVVGMLVTNKPIEKFDKKNEIILDGPSNELVSSLSSIKTVRVKYKLGDAVDVLLRLKDF